MSTACEAEFTAGGRAGKRSCSLSCECHPVDSVVGVHLFGALHISVALHLSVIMVLSDGSAGVAQKGVNTGAFPFFFYFFLPHLPPAVPAFIFIARRVRPSLSVVNNDVGVCGDVLSHGLLTNLSLSTVW